MVKKERSDKSGRGTLRGEILKMLEKAPSKRLAISELKKKLEVKKEVGEIGRWYHSQVYRTLNSLERERKIRMIAERVPGRVESRMVAVLEEEKYAGPSEVETILKHILSPEKAIRENAAEDFQTLFQKKRVVISSELSRTLKSILADKSYMDVWQHIIRGLWSALVAAKSKDDAQTIVELKGLESVLIKIASNNSSEKEARKQAIEVLAKLETREAMNLIFEILARSNDETYNELKNCLAQALVFLHPNFGFDIKERLYQLVGNKSTKDRAEFVLTQLRQRVVR